MTSENQETETQEEIEALETAPEVQDEAETGDSAASASVLPMVLGGVLAGAIGFGVAWYMTQQQGGPDPVDQRLSVVESNLRQELTTHADALGKLSQQMDDVAPPFDASALEAAITGLETRISGVEGHLNQLDTRLTALEKRPVAEGISDAAVAAYERDLAALQDKIAAERAEFEAMVTEATRKETSSEVAAQDTLRRAALARIQTAIELGTPFAAPVVDLQSTGVEVSGVLKDAAGQGVASLPALQDSFPEAARAALATSRMVNAQGQTGAGVGSFLKSQLGMRSLTPREGSDPDAVLSRAEAAVKAGRLNDALAELDALPVEGRAEMTEWSARTAQRLEAIAAAGSLAETLK